MPLFWYTRWSNNFRIGYLAFVTLALHHTLAHNGYRAAKTLIRYA
jgi:hypothetical protein